MKAEEAEDLQTALKAVHEARENLMSIGRLTGEDKTAAQAEPERHGAALAGASG
jgi:hypothetical protein